MVFNAVIKVLNEKALKGEIQPGYKARLSVFGEIAEAISKDIEARLEAWEEANGFGASKKKKRPSWLRVLSGGQKNG